MKQPYFVTNKKGKQVKKQRFVHIAAVVAMRLKEDEESLKIDSVQTEEDDSPATYRGAYLLISNPLMHQRKRYSRMLNAGVLKCSFEQPNKN